MPCSDAGLSDGTTPPLTSWDPGLGPFACGAGKKTRPSLASRTQLVLSLVAGSRWHSGFVVSGFRCNNSAVSAGGGVAVAVLVCQQYRYCCSIVLFFRTSVFGPLCEELFVVQ
ncbi:unnamed protein product [Sphagnum balticum]